MIIPGDYIRDHQISKYLPAFTASPRLLLRLSEHPGLKNEEFHSLCDDQGPLLVLAKTTNATFGGFCAQSWKSIGGYRKCKKSYLFRLSEPLRFMSKVQGSSDRSLFFSQKYGMVFGQGDLIINFSDLKKCSSKIG